LLGFLNRETVLADLDAIEMSIHVDARASFARRCLIWMQVNGAYAVLFCLWPTHQAVFLDKKDASISATPRGNATEFISIARYVGAKILASV
jgi:hypothetical protein